MNTLQRLLSTVNREVASIRPKSSSYVGNSNSSVSQNQDCGAEGEASSVKYNPIAGISPTKRNDTLESSEETQDSNDSVRPSINSINGNLKKGLRQDQDYSVRNAASSVKYSASSGVSPTESSIPEIQVQHLSRRTTRRKRKAKSKASRKQLAATEPPVDVQTISREAFRRIQRQGQQVYLIYIKPSPAVQQRALARAQRERPKDKNYPTPIGGDDPARIKRGQHDSLEI
ncbi:hypothetical protein MPH_07518 [Macrophomina phaseolina MS6]|uniref:Uncharacterized protein n=1 Tax=Macrophomina phaseolina (strain MS6) TaxID=1126212 RepID=K2RRA3_MACPH|nr:hypothetical protein MPH_07518 [Macrophomina phaseolina MS6]